MSEGDERHQAPETGDENASETPRQAETGQGPSPAQAAPGISGDDQTSGQTQTPADDDDVGVPEDPGADKD